MRIIQAPQGPDFPCLIFGTGSFGKTIDTATAFSMLDRYRDAGGNCIDTGHMYGGTDGASEKIIGDYLHKRKCRQSILLSTKGGFPHRNNLHQSRLSEAELQADLNASLQALRIDFVDLFFLHRDDTSLPIAQLMPVLHRFVQAGLVRFLGASNWSTARIDEANQFAIANQLTPFVFSQLQWSLAQSIPADWQDDTIACMDQTSRDFYRKSAMPVMAFSPLTRGFFTKLANHTGLPPSIEAFASPINFRRAERVSKLANVLDISIAQLCYAYLSSTALHSAAVMGCKSITHLEDALGAQDLQLTPAQVAYLEA